MPTDGVATASYATIEPRNAGNAIGEGSTEGLRNMPSNTSTGLDDAAVIAADAAMHGGGGWMTATVSGMALLASGLSLWESTLKQPDIKIYVSENIQYTRDPYGSYEVMVVPVTIANGGARDGAILSLQLDVKNAATSQTTRFRSAYMADAQYFGSRDDVAARLKRPKLPFAPLSVAGRSAFTGTVLFYGPDPREKKQVEPMSTLEMTLTVVMPTADGWLDRLLGAPPLPATVKAEVPNFLPGALLSGDNAPLKVTSGAL